MYAIKKGFFMSIPSEEVSSNNATAEEQRYVFPLSFNFMVFYLRELMPNLGDREVAPIYTKARLDQFLIELKLLKQIRQDDKEFKIDDKTEQLLKLSPQQRANIIQLDKDLNRQFYIYGANEKPVDGNYLLEIALKDKESEIITSEDALAILLSKNYVGDVMIQGGIVDTSYCITAVIGPNLKLAFMPVNYFYHITSYSHVVMSDKAPDEVKQNDIVLTRQDGNLTAYWVADDKINSKSFKETDSIVSDIIRKINSEEKSRTDPSLLQEIASIYGCPLTLSYELKGDVKNVDKLEEDLGQFNLKQKFIYTRLDDGSYQLVLDESHSRVTVSNTCREVLFAKAHRYLNVLLSESDSDVENMSHRYFELVPYLEDRNFREDFVLVVASLPPDELEKLNSFIYEFNPTIYQEYLDTGAKIFSDVITSLKDPERYFGAESRGGTVKNELTFLYYKLAKKRLIEDKVVKNKPVEGGLRNIEREVFTKLDRILNSNEVLNDEEQNKWLKTLKLLQAFSDCSDAITRSKIVENIDLMVNKLVERNRIIDLELKSQNLPSPERWALSLEKSENTRQIAFYNNSKNQKAIVERFDIFKSLLIPLYQQDILENTLNSEQFSVCMSFIREVETLAAHPGDPAYIGAYRQWYANNQYILNQIHLLQELASQVGLIPSSQSTDIMQDLTQAMQHLESMTGKKFQTMKENLLLKTKNHFNGNLSFRHEESEVRKTIELMKIVYNIYLIHQNKELMSFSERCMQRFKGRININVKPTISEILNKILSKMIHLSAELPLSKYKELLLKIKNNTYRENASLHEVANDFLILLDTYSPKLEPLSPDDVIAWEMGRKLACLLMDIGENKLDEKYNFYETKLYPSDDVKSTTIREVPSLDDKVFIAEFLLNHRALEKRLENSKGIKTSSDIEALYNLIQKLVVPDDSKLPEGVVSKFSESRHLLLERLFTLNYEVLIRQANFILESKLDAINSKVIDELWLLNKNFDDHKKFFTNDFVSNLSKGRDETIIQKVMTYLDTPRESPFLKMHNTKESCTYYGYMKAIIERQQRFLGDGPITKDSGLAGFWPSVYLEVGSFRPTTMAELTKDDCVTDDGHFHFRGIRYGLQQDATQKFTIQEDDFKKFDNDTQKLVMQNAVNELQNQIDKKKLSGGSTLCATAAWITEEDMGSRLHLRCMSLGDSNSYVVVYNEKGMIPGKSTRINKTLHKEKINDVSVNKALGDEQVDLKQHPDFHKGEFIADDTIFLMPGESFVIVNACDGFSETIQRDVTKSNEEKMNAEVRLIGDCVIANKGNLKDLGLSIVNASFAGGSGDNISGVAANDVEFQDGKVKIQVIADGHGEGGESVSSLIADNIAPILNNEIKKQVTLEKKAEAKVSELKLPVATPGDFTSVSSVESAKEPPEEKAPSPQPGMAARAWARIRKPAIIIGKSLLIAGIFITLAALALLAALGIGAIIYVSHGVAVPSIPAMIGVAVGALTDLGVWAISLVSFGLGCWLSKKLYDKILVEKDPADVKKVPQVVLTPKSDVVGPGTQSTPRTGHPSLSQLIKDPKKETTPVNVSHYPHPFSPQARSASGRSLEEPKSVPLRPKGGSENK